MVIALHPEWGIAEGEDDFEDPEGFCGVHHDDPLDGPNSVRASAGIEETIGDCGTEVVLDLDEVTLVDVEVVRFLGACEPMAQKF